MCKSKTNSYYFFHITAELTGARITAAITCSTGYNRNLILIHHDLLWALFIFLLSHLLSIMDPAD
jgi:hypothetical protein